MSAADNCWPVHMHSGMGVCSEKWPWPMVECVHPHIWIATSVVYCTPPCTALENATPGMRHAYNVMLYVPKMFSYLSFSLKVRPRDVLSKNIITSW